MKRACLVPPWRFNITSLVLYIFHSYSVKGRADSKVDVYVYKLFSKCIWFVFLFELSSVRSATREEQSLWAECPMPSLTWGPGSALVILIWMMWMRRAQSGNESRVDRMARYRWWWWWQWNRKEHQIRIWELSKRHLGILIICGSYEAVWFCRNSNWHQTDNNASLPKILPQMPLL